MSHVSRISYVVWGIWFAAVWISFLALEIPAALRRVPWVTFSATEWDVSLRWYLAGLAMIALLQTLIFHFGFRTPLWHAAACSIVIVVAMHFLVHLV